MDRWTGVGGGQYEALLQNPKVGPVRAILRLSPLDVLLWMFNAALLSFLVIIGWHLLLAGLELQWTIVTCVVGFFSVYVAALSVFERQKWIGSSIRPNNVPNGFATRLESLFWEFLANVFLFTCIQPLDRFVMPAMQNRPTVLAQESVAQKAKVAYPILFIHGFLCNSIFWLPTQLFLWFAGVRGMYSITLSPSFGDITKFSESVSDKVGV